MIKPKALTSLSLVMPCFNEAGALPGLLEDLKVLDGYGMDYEVIVVDDGSKDDTAAIASRFAGKNPRLRLIRHETNRGVGAAVRSGLTAASKDLVCVMDADAQFRLADIDKLFSKIDSCDAVTGYRLRRQDGVWRGLQGLLWARFLRLFFRFRVHDPCCGFKLYRRSVLKGLTLRSSHLFIHAETLAALRRKGDKIEEIAVSHYPRESGKPSALSVGRFFRTIGEMTAFLARRGV